MAWPPAVTLPAAQLRAGGRSAAGLRGGACCWGGAAAHPAAHLRAFCCCISLQGRRLQPPGGLWGSASPHRRRRGASGGQICPAAAAELRWGMASAGGTGLALGGQHAPSRAAPLLAPTPIATLHVAWPLAGWRSAERLQRGLAAGWGCWGGGGGGGDRVRGADGPAAPKPLAPLLQRAAHLGPAQLRFAGLFHAEQAATAAGRGSGCASAANLAGAPGRGGDTPVHFSRAPRRGQSGADFGLTVGPLPGGRASCARGQSQTQRRPAGLGAGPCPGLAALRLGGVCQVRQHLAATAGAHLARRSSLALWWRC